MKPRESWRERYIRILSDPRKNGTDSQDDLQAMQDLIDAGYLRAEALAPMGIVSCIGGVMLPTLSGHLFLEDQRAILKSRTFIGRLKANWPLFCGILGIIVGWSLGLLSPLMQERLYPPIQARTSAATASTPTQQSATQPRPPALSIAPGTPNPSKR